MTLLSQSNGSITVFFTMIVIVQLQRIVKVFPFPMGGGEKGID